MQKQENPNRETKTGNTTDKDSNVTTEERKLLDDAEHNRDEGDDGLLTEASMDNTDEDGEPLNEKGFGEDISGDDLDVPGAEDDDNEEAIGDEDEENNNFSQADTE